ncbi:MAG TPA: hypothetical protein VHL11_19475, partial [Phototrophicaceae bacterium]|nr:hypothetical protein [Phototrophicaceae bacterium]
MKPSDSLLPDAAGQPAGQSDPDHVGGLFDYRQRHQDDRQRQTAQPNTVTIKKQIRLPSQPVPETAPPVYEPQPPIPANYLGRLSVVERILRTRQEFFAEIRGEVRLQQKIVAMMVASATFLGIYGGVMGAASGNSPILQALSSGGKLPLLFLITLIICTPSLYFFSLLFGSRQTISQNIALILTAVTTTSVLLVSFAPVALFFLTTGGNYHFVKLLHVGVFAISGLMGVVFLREGLAASVDAANPEGQQARRTVFLAWIVLYAFVGMQMAWTLRPFIGSPGREFELIRQSNASN